MTSGPAPRQVVLDGGVDAALAQIPTEAGVGQVLGDAARSLTIGRPANLRSWFGSQLGRAKVKKGQRPPTDLTAVARVLSFSVSTSSFGQRLAFERLMARYVPASARRDLKTPAYLHLDASERFPRVTIVMGGAGRSDLFGPFRDRRAADRARDGLHKLFPLRPCDFKFEPAADLALGLSCLYAQVHTCAAPCLLRMGEGDYRGLAAEALQLLAEPSRRIVDPPAWLPPFVSAASTRAVIAERGSAGLELYPVVAGVVHEDAMMIAGDDVAAAVAALSWPPPSTPGRDEPWLMSWLYERRRPGTYVVIEHAAMPFPAAFGSRQPVPVTEGTKPRESAAEVLRRYQEENLPSFTGLELRDVNQRGLFGDCPIHVAAGRGDVDDILALIEGGADVNVLGELGTTPLYAAVSQDRIDAVRVLLEHGASCAPRSELGYTAMEVAELHGRTDIVELLMKYCPG